MNKRKQGENTNRIASPQLRLLYCAHRKNLARWDRDDVRVPFWRLYWNHRPGAVLLSPEGRYPILPSHFTLVAPNTTLSTRLAGSVRHYYVHFTVSLPFSHVQNHVHQSPAEPWLLALLRRHTPTESEARESVGSPVRVAAFMTLCWHALFTLPPRLFSAACAKPRLNELLCWWENEQWRPVSNEELASRAHMEKTSFCRSFRRQMGESPQSYGLIRRIARGALLLRYSSLSIDQIAEETGFYDRYHFSRNFKKIQNTSPAAFRRAGGQG